ncbi:MAG TPA: PIG-L family deacetylase [Vicinamibacterales bacterium]|nr:PIG-L family deacetylase [Vicinamibacterales bacterium]
MKRVFLLLSISVLALVSNPTAQMRVVPVDAEAGHVALGLVLRHLANTGVLMQATAHPDDENNGLLVMMNRGLGYRTALATATRGNGGQNEIGPEIFEALGVLRTKELEAMHRFDGAEQYFTRAVDFGFSFSIEETFEKWGREEITADYVRLIRTIRPDIIIALPPGGAGGGQHHQASSIIARDAFKLAGDPTKYPEQIRIGLHPWRPKKFYVLAGFGFPGETLPPGPLARISLSGYDSLLGKTYAETGTEARSMHKCQGMAQLLSLPAPQTTTYQLVESAVAAADHDESSLFDGLDTSIAGLAKLAGARPPKDLTDGLGVIARSVAAAQKAFRGDGANGASSDAETDAAALKPLFDGVFATRVLRRTLKTLSMDEAAKDDIEFRLRQKEREFQQAILLAGGVQVDVLADDGVVVPGQPVKVSAIVVNHGPADVSVKSVRFEGFEGNAACQLLQVTAAAIPFPGVPQPKPGPPLTMLKKDQVARCDVPLQIPANAKVSEPYWHRAGEAGRYTFDDDAPFGLSFRPTPFYAQLTLTWPTVGGNEEVIEGLPVQHRYEGNIFSGEKRTELLVVPAFSVTTSPEVAIVPAAAIRSAPARPVRTTGRGAASQRGAAPQRPAAAAPSSDRDILVTVVNDTPAAAEAVVALEMPPGWTASPATQAVSFTRADETQTVRFLVKPAPNADAAEFPVKAFATAADQRFDRGFAVIEYPHITRAHIYDAAQTVVKVIDVRTPPNLTVGYVMGVGDQVPPAIQQLGVKVEMISAEELGWGDLSRFDAIVTGVRAYERRADLRANNSRLLDYVFKGGTLIVQYNKFEFNEAQYGPYPTKVSSDRVTAEDAPVQVLDAHNPIFTTPNEIVETAWKNWVQERGLYFLGEKDSRYRDLVQLEDPFPFNKGVKRGALVEAQYGKGRWIYVGLGLWRQLPAGTDGAYQLLANLISLGKQPQSSPNPRK